MSEAVPRVSVVIPAYNAAHCIRRAIGSAQSQTERDLEIIVVDDASIDDTAMIVATMAQRDNRIRLISADRNGGPSATRNIAIENARGKWIALLDADDAFRPERLRSMCDLAEANTLDAIGDDIIYYDEMARQEVRKGGFVRGPGLRGVSLDAYLATSTYHVGLAEALYREETPISLLKLVIRRDFLMAHPVRYSSRYRYCEDFLFYFDLLREGAKLGVVDDAWYIYTEQLGSISRRSSPHSRTVADRQSVVDAVDEILANVADLSHRQRKLLSLRRRSTTKAMRFDAFRRDTADLGKAAISARLLLKPSLALRFARELRHGLQSRLRSRAVDARG